MILLRHGQTIFNVIYGETRKDPGVRDPRLTETGRAQAARAAEALRGEIVRRLITSPYWRALETAEIVATALDLPVTVDARVRERAAFACDIGTVRSKLAERWKAFGFDHIDHVWWHEEEEIEADFTMRCHRFRHDMAGVGDWAETAIVTHWGVIRSLTGQRIGNGEMIRLDAARPGPAPSERT